MENLIIRKAKIDDFKNIVKLFNKEIAREGFYRKVDEDLFRLKFKGLNNFDLNGFILAFDGDQLIGFVICTIRRENEGVINCLVVKHDYRLKGIGRKLIEEAEFYYKSKGIRDILVYGYLPIGYAWNIPETKNHYHPCAPGVPVGSELYDFLSHFGFKIKTYNDAFHLDLLKYNLPDEINKILENNEAEGIKIEYYNGLIHQGLEEFCKDINHPSFEKCIFDNLKLNDPYPFMIVNDNGKVKGWTGAKFIESNGRGHIDGIQLHDDVKGRGLGKALFNVYVNELKKDKAKYMTFYTGRDNFARNIYTGAGFEIVQSFAILEKKI